jgi:predicted amidohydrolase
MKIGIVQYSPVWEKREENFERIVSLTEKEGKNCDLIILPEMSLTGFTMNTSAFAEELDGETVKNFIALSRKLKTNFLVGIIEKDGEQIFNSLFHFDKNGIIAARYRKIHLFSFAKEDKFYSSSSEIVVTKIENRKVGLSICYDLRFPELYRLQTKQGAELLINIANWPLPRIFHWRELLKARAIENLAFVVGVNRIGTDPFNTYNGQSLCYNPKGEVIFDAQDKEGFFTFEIELAETKNVRTEFGFLNDIKLI